MCHYGVILSLPLQSVSLLLQLHWDLPHYCSRIILRFLSIPIVPKIIMLVALFIQAYTDEYSLSSYPKQNCVLDPIS